MTETQIDILVAVIGLPLFALGFYFWAKAARHMYGLINNFKAGREWGKYLAFSMFMSSFFTDEGNYHRKEMLKYTGFFILFCGTPFIFVGLHKMLFS